MCGFSEHPPTLEPWRKQYVSVTSCFATGLDNTFTHQTDATLVTIDKAMTAAGLHKITELVLPHTWGMTALPDAKVNQAHALGAKLATFKKKDDETLKRYLLLFGMIAVMALDHGHPATHTRRGNQLLVALCQLCDHLFRLTCLFTALRNVYAP